MLANGHINLKTLQTQDTSALVSWVRRSELSGHFDTSAKMPERQFRPKYQTISEHFGSMLLVSL